MALFVSLANAKTVALRLFIQIVYMHELEAEGGDPTVMIDPRACWPTEVAVEVLKLARICTDFDSSKRPSMREVFMSCSRSVVSMLDLQL